MKYVPDRTGRFSKRPHYRPEELDRECEATILRFLRELHGKATFPISTDDLTRLVERDADDLDLFADLSGYGSTVEGLTAFHPGKKPHVKISCSLSGDSRRENRLRTTLTHEWGHARFHAYLWDEEPPSRELLSRKPHAGLQICQSGTIIDARETDWMEWQAGYICGAILMPASQVRSLVGEYFQAEGNCGFALAGSLHENHVIAAVAHSFGVSEAAARIRLIKLKLISAERPPSLFDLPPAA